ncbi:MAG: sialidase family protein, partial [Polyangiales bacterium]
IVVLASSDLGYTRECLPPEPGSDCEVISAGGSFLTQPRGFYKTPGFMDIGVYTTFDRGKTWKKSQLDHVVPPDDPKVRARGEGPLVAMADGTFYIGFNAINWGEWESQPATFFPNGGVGVIKSTDGGSTWNWTSYSHTPADWPYGGNDLSTGEFFVTSGLAGLSNLGPRSTGKADAPEGSITDRWISSTKDGVTWTDPQPLGGDDAGRHVPGSHSHVAAANGIMATMFLVSDSASCGFFTGEPSASCVVFQTTTDAGKTWKRHRVPTPAGFAPAALSVLLGADPTKTGYFSAILLNENGQDIRIYNTPDSGETWGDPVTLSEDSAKTHFAPWAGYSAKGKLGVMWRSYESDAANPLASPPYKPYSVWAAISLDGGATFSKPLKVSKNNSPAPPDDPNDSLSIVGDHGPSGIALDDDDGVYVVWADWSSGERSIHFSSVNAKAFTP